MRLTNEVVAAAALATGAILAVPTAAGADSSSSGDVFVPSAQVNGKEVTLPLHEARTSDGRTAWFVVIEASDGDAAQRWNVGVVNKLASAATGAQGGRLDSAGRLVVDATVDFTSRRDVRGTPGTGFAAKRVTLELTDGFARKNAVRYLSTDDRLGPSEPGGVQQRPTGVTNPQRQGVNSALLGEGDPLNVMAWTPNLGRYSPLWDVHLTAWPPGRQPVRVTDFAEVENLAEDGGVTGPGGAPWRANNVVVNCPIIVQL